MGARIVQAQQPQLLLKVILLLHKTFSDIGIDVAIAKEPSLISILILLLQKTLRWY